MSSTGVPPVDPESEQILAEAGGECYLWMFRPRTASRTTTAVMMINTKTSPGPNKITLSTGPHLLI